MRYRLLITFAILGAGMSCLPAHAQSNGRVSVGPTIWRHDTNLTVERATDFDGSNNTTDQQEKDWDVLGSGVGIRVNYDLPRLLSVHGEVGITQATVQDRDVIDPDQDIGSLGLNSGAYYTLGARLSDDFADGKHFWMVGGALNIVSTELDEDINTNWDYDETNLSVDGRLGTWVKQIGAYAGLRFVSSSADLRETDRANPVGQQIRTVEMGRDGTVDVLIGARTRGPDVSGFTELGLVGTFSASAGLSVAF